MELGLVIAQLYHYVRTNSDNIDKSKTALIKLNTNVDYSYPEEEIAHRLRVSGSKLVLTDASYPSVINDFRIKPLLNGIICNRNSFEDDSAASLVLFTSGTTGKPKGVVHSLSTLSHQLSDLHQSWEISKEDEFLISLPLNHIHGLVTGMLNGLMAGSSLRMHSHFDAGALWNELRNPRTTFFTAVPTIYSRLLSHFRANNERMKLDHLRLMISGSSPLSELLLGAWIENIREAGIVERYGMTETGMISSNDIRSSKPGHVGKAFPSVELEIGSRIGDEDEFGQVKVRGPGLFKGYLDQQTGEFIPRSPEDFFTTGDQGFLTDTGDLKLVGRDRDILKVSGFKIGCGEIEYAIMNHPGIQECAVVGLSDPKDSSNQLIGALLISESSSDKLIEDLRKFLSTKLAHYKIPRKWVVSRDQLPRNLIGKPEHKEILKLFQ